MVANSIQNLPAFVDSGQHSIVTAPADTRPSPRMRNLILRGSGRTSLLPAPVVALSCRGSSTLIIAFPFVVHPQCNIVPDHYQRAREWLHADESWSRFAKSKESRTTTVIWNQTARSSLERKKVGYVQEDSMARRLQLPCRRFLRERGDSFLSLLG